LAISGEQRSAKTVLSKLLKALIDSNVAPVRALSRGSSQSGPTTAAGRLRSPTDTAAFDEPDFPTEPLGLIAGAEEWRRRRHLVPAGDGRPGMIGRGTDRDEQVGASRHVERFAVRSDSEDERLMRDRNRNARRVGGYLDRCVAARVEDVECPSVGRDGHVEGLVLKVNRSL